MRNVLSRRSALLCSSLLLMSLPLAGCGGDEGDGGSGGDAPKLAPTGSFTATIDGTAHTVDYTGGKVVAEVVHKLADDANGYGCVTTLFVSVQKADGTCPLEMTFQPGAGDGLQLKDATFYASKGIKQGGVVISTVECAGFPGADKGGEVAWKLSGGDGMVLVAPVPPGEANKKLAVIANQTLQPKGKVKLKNGGKMFELDLSSVTIKGDIDSTGSTQVSCGTAVGEGLCPKGVNYGNKIGDHLPRPMGGVRCDDDSPFDPGELCGSPATVLVSYQHWVTKEDNWGGKEVIGALAKTLSNYEGVRMIFVVLTGKEKVVVEDPPDSGKFAANGPAPTKADCEEIKKLYGLGDDVIMIYDKDKTLTSTVSNRSA